jgi:hypothetical protein
VVRGGSFGLLRVEVGGKSAESSRLEFDPVGLPLEGAVSSRDKLRQHGAAAIFAAGSRSHQANAVFLG